MFANYSLKIVRAINWMAGRIVTLTMALIVLNIILRVFSMPIGGTYEWVGFLTALAISLSLAHCELHEGHVAVTIFMDKLPLKFQQVIDLATKFVILIFLVITVFETISYANSTIVAGDIAQTTKVPIYPFIYIIAFSFVTFALITIVKLIDTIRKVVGN